MRTTPSPLPPPLSPPPLPSRPSGRPSGSVVALTVVMWLAWLGVTLVADFLGFLMFAFADSPGSGAAAQAMIVPAFLWFAFAFAAGAVLLILRRWWTIVVAFVLAASPPFLIFAGYNLLDGAGGNSRGSGGVIPAAGAPTTAPAPTPLPSARVPAGGFRPPPLKVREQPDFRHLFPPDPTTRPAATAPATQP